WRAQADLCEGRPDGVTLSYRAVPYDQSHARTTTVACKKSSSYLTELYNRQQYLGAFYAVKGWHRPPVGEGAGNPTVRVCGSYGNAHDQWSPREAVCGRRRSE